MGLERESTAGDVGVRVCVFFFCLCVSVSISEMEKQHKLSADQTRVASIVPPQITSFFLVPFRRR